MFEDYSFSDFITLLQNPQAILGELNHWTTEINKKIHKRYYPKNGLSVMKEYWDNLIILDGCRYDLFESTKKIECKLICVQSLSSTSSEFWKKISVIADSTIRYISSNPFVGVLDPGTFHDVYWVMETDWDETHRTVLPEAVTNATLKAYQDHPDKRLIIHYMQPHYPFIGEIGTQIEHRGISNRSTQSQSATAGYTVWGQLQYRIADFSRETAWNAYRENLQLVLPHASTLIDELGGKSVITADHGNMVGDRQTPIPIKGYEHTGSLRVKCLIDVPWLVVDTDHRRTVTSEQPSNQEIKKASQDKLEALRYL